jgi:hypothetical protein
LTNFGELNDVKLIITNYVLKFDEKVFEFDAIVCNAWNRTFVAYYINLLIGEIQRKLKMKIDGVIWKEEISLICDLKKDISAVVGKKVILTKQNFWIENKKILEITNVGID